MAHPASVAQEISLFRSRILNRWFDDATLRVLESILVSKDVQLLIGVRSVLKQFMNLLRLSLCSCLALRYEALVMRDERANSHPGLYVTCKEWLTFAEHSLGNGFYAIANQACENALMCSRTKEAAHSEMDNVYHDVYSIKKIKRLKDIALLKISSQSVQAQAEAHLKQKKVEHSKHHLATSIVAEKGNSRFRSGTKNHNLRKLHNYQRLGNPD